MKLFKRLLVAPATLALLTPLATNATEVNLDEVSNYSSKFDINSMTFENSSSDFSNAAQVCLHTATGIQRRSVPFSDSISTDHISAGAGAATQHHYVDCGAGVFDTRQCTMSQCV